MRRIKLLLLLLASSCFVYAQDDFPDYWKVTNKFFSLYRHESMEGHVLGFALKKDGWHVLTIQPVDEKTVTDQLFWSKQKWRYQVLENFLRATEEPANEKALAYINSSSYNAYGYTRCPYYGYNGWDADIIKDFGDRTSLSDTLLEALARAHSAYASRYLWYQYGGSNLSEDTLTRKLGRIELPGDERVKMFTHHIEKSTGLYGKIYERNKNYETIVGNIGRKWFNEHVHGYMQLMMGNRPVEAARFLSGCRIPADDSLASLNLLNSMAENAIVFTYSDNDTYPLQYLQAKYNIRKDVTILNTGLLGLSAFIDHLKRNGLVKFSTPASEYGRKDFDFAVFYAADDVGRKLKLDQFLAGYKNLKRLEAMGGDSIRVHDVRHVYMPWGRDTLQIPLRNYIPMNEYMMYDIVASNFQTRPIYFTDYYQEFPVQHMELSGIVLQLSPQSTTYIGINAAVARSQEEFIKTKYKTPFNKDTRHSYLISYVADKHADLFLPLIQFKLRAGEKSAATDLIKQFIAPFEDNIPFTQRIDSLAPVLYENGFEVMGDKIVAKYLESIMKLWTEKTYSLYFDDKRILNRINEVGEILKKYKRDISPVALAILQLTPH